MGMTNIDQIAGKYADIFVARFSEIDAYGWTKPWISVRPDMVPQNISGRAYHNGNSLFLMLATSVKDYRYPLFMTYNQARTFGASVLKGETSFPVVYWTEDVCDALTGKKAGITPEEYRLLDKEDKLNYKLRYRMIKNNVFNLDQTDMATARPDLVKKIVAKYDTGSAVTVREAEVSKVDKMLLDQSWLCPIKLSDGNSAYYSLSKDYIELPSKDHFPDQGNFYGTLFHEMTHSTGHAGRLDRDMTGSFGSKLYAGEELVAELSSAILSGIAGLDSTIKEDSLQYLKNWSIAISEDPKLIFTAVAKASAAANMICRELKLEQSQGLDMSDLDENKSQSESVSDAMVESSQTTAQHIRI